MSTRSVELTNPLPTVTVAAAPSAVRAGAASAAVAVVVNAALFLGGLAAGATYVLRPTTDAAEIPVVLPIAVAMTVLPLVLASVAFALVRGRRQAIAALAWAGLAVGVVTAVLPLSMQGGLLDRSILAALHVVTGLAWFWGSRRQLP